MKQIQLPGGYVALVDDADFEKLNFWKWYRHDKGYAVRQTKSNGVVTNILMHRLVADAPSGSDVDHIDGNPLNNSKSNLRLCNHAQNMQNRKISTNNTSGYKGVFWERKDSKWRARIHVGGKKINLGSFTSAIEAAKKYDLAALQYHAQFARLNGV